MLIIELPEVSTERESASKLTVVAVSSTLWAVGLHAHFAACF